MDVQIVYVKDLQKMEVPSEKKSPEVFVSIRKFFLKTFTKVPTDPLDILPKKVLNKIFGYCRGYDILNYSLVNRKWYKFIARSSVCMDKIKIVLAEPTAFSTSLFPQFLPKLFTTSDANLMIYHGRKYRHITIASMERQLLTQHKLLLAHFKWKTVGVYNHTFKSQMDLINFLGMLEPFVVELELRNIKHGRCTHQICQSNFQFPKLTKLIIVNCYTFIYADPFRHVKTINNLTLATDALPNYTENPNEQLIERVRAIQTILLNNIDVEHMELFIHQNDFDALFMDQRFLSRIKFHLKSFYVGKFKQEDREGINIVQISNFVEFLKSQENTLSLLHLDNWLGNATMEYAINDMQLKDLTIANLESFGRHNDSLGSISLFSNDTIEHLTIWTESAKHLYLTNEILKVCRGLRVLEIRTINQAILETIIEYNDDVELIVCDFFTAYMPPEKAVLRSLRAMTINVTCADNFRDLIRFKERMTNFEMVFLQAAREAKRRWNSGNGSGSSF